VSKILFCTPVYCLTTEQIHFVGFFESTVNSAIVSYRICCIDKLTVYHWQSVELIVTDDNNSVSSLVRISVRMRLTV